MFSLANLIIVCLDIGSNDLISTPSGNISSMDLMVWIRFWFDFITYIVSLILSDTIIQVIGNNTIVNIKAV